MDIGFSGLPYTWYNKRAPLAVVFERLDMGVANQQWLNLYNARAEICK